MVPPSHGSNSEQAHGQGDPDFPPENEEFFDRPDADDMEEAISKFLNGLKKQERSSFKEIHSYSILFQDLR
jgi:hypothetical protein